MAEESMSEGRTRVDRATVTWRALVLILLTVIGAMSTRILNQIDKTSELATSTQALVGVLNGRIDAHAQRLDTLDRRNDAQDRSIEQLADRVWRALPGNVRGTP